MITWLKARHMIVDWVLGMSACALGTCILFSVFAFLFLTLQVIPWYSSLVIHLSFHCLFASRLILRQLKNFLCSYINI